MVEHHLHGSGTLLGLVALGHDPHPSQGRKRHQTRDGSGGHPGSTPRSTSSATSSNAPSTSSKPTGRWPPATTVTTPSAEPSTSPRSGSGYMTPSDDPRDTL